MAHFDYSISFSLKSPLFHLLLHGGVEESRECKGVEGVWGSQKGVRSQGGVRTNFLQSIGLINFITKH